MLILILFAFLAGVVTILSPCILPILPIILSGGIGGGKKRPLGIVTGFVISFSFFTLALSAIVKLTGVSADVLRTISIVIIFGFGLTLLVPKFQLWMEQTFSKLAGMASQKNEGSGFGGGVLLGCSLGLIWTPCVGPIIASVITLAATSTVNFAAVFITIAYSIGTALPMFAIIYGGRQLLQKVPWLLKNTGKIQKAFGVLMILTALAIFFNVDRKFQTYILEKFPEYGTGLVQLEDNELVKKQLEKISGEDNDLIKNNIYPSAPELIQGGEWFNSEPLKIADLKGKVVLIDFWTYTCINCIRTLPYLETWHEKYADKGLVIIGVHTPEFEFEKDADNVEQAIEDFGLKYAVMQDNDYATWRVYKNRYWPAKYFIDKDGKVRNTHFGEGAYDESEKLIQQLLEEAGSDVENIEVENLDYSINSNTPEIYLGYGRIDGFASLEKIQKDKDANYTMTEELGKNEVAYGGKWNVGKERAMPAQDAELTLNFESQEVFLVMRSEASEGAGVQIYIDGSLITDAQAGDDVQDGVVTVTKDRLYKLVKFSEPGRHTLKLEFLDGNTELYAFTFG